MPPASNSIVSATNTVPGTYAITWALAVTAPAPAGFEQFFIAYSPDDGAWISLGNPNQTGPNTIEFDTFGPPPVHPASQVALLDTPNGFASATPFNLAQGAIGVT